VSDATVFDNDLIGVAQEGSGTLQVLNDETDLPSRISLLENRIDVAAGLSGIYMRDPGKDITISGNEIEGGGGGSAGIRFDNILVNGLPRTAFSVVDNKINNFKAGIVFVSRGDPYLNVEIRSNGISHDQSHGYDTIGILFIGTGPYELFAQLLFNVFGNGIRTRISVTDD
jgi:hypothetical protein